MGGSQNTSRTDSHRPSNRYNQQTPSRPRTNMHRSLQGRKSRWKWKLGRLIHRKASIGHTDSVSRRKHLQLTRLTGAGCSTLRRIGPTGAVKSFSISSVRVLISSHTIMTRLTCAHTSDEGTGSVYFVLSLQLPSWSWLASPQSTSS